MCQFDEGPAVAREGAAGDGAACHVLNAGGSDGDAQARSDQTDYSDPVRRFLDDAVLKSLLRTKVHGAVPGGGSGGFWEKYEGLVPQLEDAHFGETSEGMSARQDDDEFLLQEGMHGEIGDGGANAEKTNVDRAIANGIDEMTGAGFLQAKFDIGIEAAILAENGGQVGLHAGADEADAERAGFAAAQAAGEGEIFGDAEEGSLGAVEKGRAGFGELDGAGGADQQRVPY